MSAVAQPSPRADGKQHFLWVPGLFPEAVLAGNPGSGKEEPLWDTQAPSLAPRLRTPPAFPEYRCPDTPRGQGPGPPEPAGAPHPAPSPSLLRVSLLCSGLPSPRPWVLPGGRARPVLVSPPHAPTRAPGGPSQPARPLADAMPGSPPPAGQCGAHCLVASLSRGAAPTWGILCALSTCLLVSWGPPGGVVGDSLLLPSSGAGLGPVGLGAQAEQMREPCDHGLSLRRVQRPRALQSAGPSPSLSGPHPSCGPPSTAGVPVPSPYPRLPPPSAADGNGTPGIRVTR